MREDQTFGECLTELLRKKHMTVADLTRRMNYRSTTSISRLLRDEVRFSSIEEFMSRLEPVSAWMLTEEELQALRRAMEVSRTGRAKYRAYRDIWRLVSEAGQAQPWLRLECHGEADCRSLRDLAERWHRARRLEMVIVNSGYENLFRELEEILRLYPEKDVSIRHYLISPDAPGLLARQLGALLSVLHDRRYQACYQPWRGEGRMEYGELNCLTVYGEDEDGVKFTQVLSMQSEERGLLYGHGGAEEFGVFFRHVVESGCPGAVPIKPQQPKQELLARMTDVCRQHLTCEQNRVGYCLTTGVCLKLVAPELLERVLRESVPQEDCSALMEVHRLRYANAHEKKKRSVFVFSGRGLETFVRTGRMTGLMAGVRPFTRSERAAVLRDIARRCRENVYLAVRVLRPGLHVRPIALAVYEDLGVYLTDERTEYDPNRSGGGAFLLLPEFASALSGFFRDELFEKHVLSETESLDLIKALALQAEKAED